MAEVTDPHAAFELRMSLRAEARRYRIARWAERVRRPIAGRVDEPYAQALDRQAAHWRGGTVVGAEVWVLVPVIARPVWGHIQLRAIRMPQGWRFQPDVHVVTRREPTLRWKTRRRVQRLLPWWSLEELNA